METEKEEGAKDDDDDEAGTETMQTGSQPT